MFLSTEAVISYFNRYHKNETVRASRERLFLLPLCILFKKHSCLTENVNDQINIYKSSGLLQNWINKYLQARYLILKPDYHRMGNQPLDMAQLFGIFMLGFILLTLSCVVFFFEILSKHFKLVQSVLEFLTNSNAK